MNYSSLNAILQGTMHTIVSLEDSIAGFSSREVKQKQSPLRGIATCLAEQARKPCFECATYGATASWKMFSCAPKVHGKCHAKRKTRLSCLLRKASSYHFPSENLRSRGGVVHGKWDESSDQPLRSVVAPQFYNSELKDTSGAIEMPQLLSFIFFDARLSIFDANTKVVHSNRFKAQWISKGIMAGALGQNRALPASCEAQGDFSLALQEADTTLPLLRRGAQERSLLALRSRQESLIASKMNVGSEQGFPKENGLRRWTKREAMLALQGKKMRLQRLTQIAYYQSGKIVVQTLLPLHPPVALITLNLSGMTAATSADTYIPIDGELNTYWCSFLESRLMGLYGGKASSLLLNRQQLLTSSCLAKQTSDALPNDKPCLAKQISNDFRLSGSTKHFSQSKTHFTKRNSTSFSMHAACQWCTGKSHLFISKCTRPFASYEAGRGHWSELLARTNAPQGRIALKMNQTSEQAAIFRKVFRRKISQSIFDARCTMHDAPSVQRCKGAKVQRFSEGKWVQKKTFAHVTSSMLHVSASRGKHISKKPISHALLSPYFEEVQRKTFRSRHGNLFQSNIGTEEIQTATFLATAMVNRWALSYSYTPDKLSVDSLKSSKGTNGENKDGMKYSHLHSIFAPISHARLSPYSEEVQKKTWPCASHEAGIAAHFPCTTLPLLRGGAQENLTSKQCIELKPTESKMNHSEERYHSLLENDRPLLFTRATYLKEKNDSHKKGTKQKLGYSQVFRQKQLHKRTKTIESIALASQEASKADGDPSVPQIAVSALTCGSHNTIYTTLASGSPLHPSIALPSGSSSSPEVVPCMQSTAPRPPSVQGSDAVYFPAENLCTFTPKVHRTSCIALKGIAGVLDSAQKVTRMSRKKKKVVSSFTTSLIKGGFALNCTYFISDATLSYSPKRISLENVAIAIPLRTHVFQLFSPLQFSISQRDQFYPGWFRLYLPDIEATEFMKNVANYYYSQSVTNIIRFKAEAMHITYGSACFAKQAQSLFDRTGALNTENPIFLVSSFSKKKERHQKNKGIEDEPVALAKRTHARVTSEMLQVSALRVQVNVQANHGAADEKSFSTGSALLRNKKNKPTSSGLTPRREAFQKLPPTYNDVFLLEKELIYHSLVNNCFSKAFFLIDQNRQLTDYFADYLVRFQILRQHQILYLFSTVLFSCKKQI